MSQTNINTDPNPIFQFSLIPITHKVSDVILVLEGHLLGHGLVIVAFAMLYHKEFVKEVSAVCLH